MVAGTRSGAADGSGVQISPDRVASLSDQIGTATAEFGTGLRRVDDDVRNLLGAGWKGTPGSQFHDAFVEWHEGAAKVVAGMTELVAALHAVATNLRSADAPR
jgi:WXG100 family type VII secretion target